MAQEHIGTRVASCAPDGCGARSSTARISHVAAVSWVPHVAINGGDPSHAAARIAVIGAGRVGGTPAGLGVLIDRLMALGPQVLLSADRVQSLAIVLH